MKNRKLMVSILAGVMALVILLTLVASALPYLVSAKGESSSELKQQLTDLQEEKKEIDQQIANLQGQLSSNVSDMQAIVQQKDTIDQEIFMLYQKLENINEQIATYGNLIADKQEELDEAQARLADLNAKNKERIRAMEEDGNLSYWSVLFKASSFSDLLDRMNMIEEIAAADKRRLQEISEAAKAVEEAKATLEVEKAALEVNKQELLDTQSSLEEKRKEADKLLAELVALGEEYEAMLDQAEAEAGQLAADISDMEDQYEDAKYQEWLATSVPATTAGSSNDGNNGGNEGGTPNDAGGKTWLVPCSYTKFSSPFGWRIHPVYGTRKFHYGVDLSAPQGTPIVATRSGTVTIAKYSSSAGYYVSIDHGDGYGSVYMHMTHYIVAAGDSVSAGQVIGYVGSTGVSTGPHLHFGITYNGAYVNPANYIKI